jgi:hypothetical protein
VPPGGDYLGREGAGVAGGGAGEGVGLPDGLPWVVPVVLVSGMAGPPWSSEEARANQAGGSVEPTLPAPAGGMEGE